MTGDQQQEAGDGDGGGGRGGGGGTNVRNERVLAVDVANMVTNK